MKQILSILALSISTLVLSQNYLEKGDQVNNFTFQTINGEKISLDDLKGKVVYINFFATWCKPCIKELALMEKHLLNDIEDDDFFFIALGRGHTAEELQKFKDDKAYNFLIGTDTDKSLFKRFSEKGIPLNVIIDKNGKLIYKENGFSIAGFKKIKRKIKRQLWF